MAYDAPLDEMAFALQSLANVQRLEGIEGFEAYDPELIAPILEEAGKLARDVLAPLNSSGDKAGAVLTDDGVKAAPGFAEAYAQFRDGGWMGLAVPEEYGGQGLPKVLSLAVMEMVHASNMAFGLCPMLSFGAIEALLAHGTEEQKTKYLPKLVSADWTGTMNLTEPQAGSDVGALKSKAIPNGDGSYAITGQKIYITWGDHDVAENIIHLVLARLPNAPEGVKGISLFVVPKFRTNEDGSVGDRNGVVCGSIEHKMGIHANSTCVMNFDDAWGQLVGEPHKGLKAMFIMMNAARLGVAMQGLGIAEVAYQNGVAYAKDRLQMRSLTGTKAPEKPADPIIVHPDVRRMLLKSKAIAEGARALSYWTGMNLDIADKHPDEDKRQQADDLVALLTPIVKAYQTDMGTEIANECLQVYGGHGYIAEWGMEQYVRDARIAQIYEGTNGIQALDLVGRKLPSKGGRAVMAFFAAIDQFASDNADNSDLAPFLEALAGVKADAVEATQWFMANAMQNPDNAGAGANDYLKLMALTCLTVAWAQSAKVAFAAKGSDAFYDNKLTTAHYFIERLLPERHAHLAGVKAGAETMMKLPAEAF